MTDAAVEPLWATRNRHNSSDELTLIMDAISQVREEQKAQRQILEGTKSNLVDLSRKFALHVETEESMLQGVVKSAFPLGDMNAHRAEHELIIQKKQLAIQKSQQWARIRDKYIAWTVQKGILIGLILLFVWSADTAARLVFHKDTNYLSAVIQRILLE